MKFEIPVPYSIFESDYEFDKFITFLKSIESYIDSLYFPVGFFTINKSSFGIRTSDTGIHNVVVIDAVLRELFQEIKCPYKILVNDIYNDYVLQQPEIVIKKLDYYSDMINIKSVVIADTSIINVITNKTDQYKFCLSTNAYRGVNELMNIFLLENSKHINEIIVTRDVNRDLDSVDKILKLGEDKGAEVIFMLNEGCVLNCPFREAGDVEICLNGDSFNIHGHGCLAFKQEVPWLFLTSPFLTRNMLQKSQYKGHTLKIAGRNKNTKYIKKVFQYYINNEELTLAEFSNINMLENIKINDLDTNGFENQVFSCNKQCLNCRKCEKTYMNLIGVQNG